MVWSKWKVTHPYVHAKNLVSAQSNYTLLGSIPGTIVAKAYAVPHHQSLSYIHFLSEGFEGRLTKQ